MLLLRIVSLILPVMLCLPLAVTSGGDIIVGDAGNVPYAPKALFRYDGQTGAETTLTSGGLFVQPFGLGNLAEILLTVTTAGTGTGSLASSPSGIDCGSTCGTSFDSGRIAGGLSPSPPRPTPGASSPAGPAATVRPRPPAP